MYRKILVPYDGSPQASRALDHAVSLAKSNMEGYTTDVIMLHVLTEFPTYHFIDRPARSLKTGEKTTLSRYLKEVYEMMREGAADMVAKKKDAIMKDTNFEIKTRVSVGDHIADTILRIAAKEKVDLIIIGNVGRSGVSKIKTLGSVSRSVSERADCPVMIVH